MAVVRSILILFATAASKSSGCVVYIPYGSLVPDPTCDEACREGEADPCPSLFTAQIRSRRPRFREVLRIGATKPERVAMLAPARPHITHP